MYDFGINPIEKLEDNTFCVWATYITGIYGERMTSRNFFDTYEEAQAFVAANE